ncbi:MAG: PepSY-like domain-containing protein [Bacteroidetes bacterium]|nr:PepSY-like domain-containing protein [Bacteroidota bacterium]
MKNVLIVALAMMGSIALAQQTKETGVPAHIKSAFAKAYPQAKNVKWDNEEGKYEASFKADGVDHSVLYETNGSVFQTETSIAIAHLPNEVAEYVKTHYKNEKIKEAAKIISADGSLTYEAEIKGYDLIFDEHGKFVKALKN